MEIALNVRFKKLLKKNDLTLTQISRSTGIPIQTLHNWLHGQEPRSFIQVKKLANYFSISVDNLVYENDEKEFLPISASTFQELSDELNLGVFEVVLRKRSDLF